MASKDSKAPKRKRPGDNTSKFLSHRPIKKFKKREFKSSKNPNLIPLGKNKILVEKEDKAETTMKKKKKKEKGSREAGLDAFLLSTAPAAQQLLFFLDRFQSANGFKLSPLELEAFKDTCIVELPQGMDQDVDNFSKHMMATFGTCWREVLCDAKLSEGMIDAGSPAILIISTSALRSLELLRGLKPFTRDCRPVKLFAKHMKLEEQDQEVNRHGCIVPVTIISGCPRHAPGCQGLFPALTPSSQG